MGPSNAHNVLMKKNGTNQPAGNNNTGVSLKNISLKDRIEHYKKIDKGLSNGAVEFRSTSNQIKACFSMLVGDLVDRESAALKGVGIRATSESNEIKQLKERSSDLQKRTKQIAELVKKIEAYKLKVQAMKANCENLSKVSDDTHHLNSRHSQHSSPENPTRNRTAKRIYYQLKNADQRTIERFTTR